MPSRTLRFNQRFPRADHQCGSAEKFTPDISLDEARRVLLQPADFVTIHCGLRESALRRRQEGL